MDVTDRTRQQKNRDGRGVSSPARRFELRPLLATAIGLTLLALAIVAAATLQGGLRGLDEWVLLALRTPGDTATPIGPMWFQDMVRDVSALGSTFVLTFVVVVVAGYLWIVDAPQKAAFLVVAVALGTLLNRLLKLAVGRPRPDIVAHATYVSNESFPSGHAANSAIVYLVLGMMLARVEANYTAKVFIFSVCVLTTLMVGMSRMYLGVHWPSDVIAGWLVGGLWALLSWYVLVRLQPRGTRH
jgi:undecaprenyl-diphosphatase